MILLVLVLVLVPVPVPVPVQVPLPVPLAVSMPVLVPVLVPVYRMVVDLLRHCQCTPALCQNFRKLIVHSVVYFMKMWPIL